jgi:hypothetical protein
MADLVVDGESVTLAMSRLEHLEGFRGDITAPLNSVTTVRAVDDPWAELRGIRAPGTGIPGIVAVGTRRGTFGKDFAVVHGKGRAVVVEFTDREFQQWVLTVENAEAVAARLAEATIPS